MKTMNDLYQDGSEHIACSNCSECISCGDCGCDKVTHEELREAVCRFFSDFVLENGSPPDLKAARENLLEDLLEGENK